MTMTDFERAYLDKLERQNWLLGAIESQISILMKLYAEQCGKSITWFDPTDPANEHTVPRPKDGDDGKVESIQSYLPKKLRKGSAKVDFYEVE